MKSEKIIIELPAGLSAEENEKALKISIGLINKSLPRRRIEKAIEMLRSSVWGQGPDKVFEETAPV